MLKLPADRMTRAWHGYRIHLYSQAGRTPKPCTSPYRAPISSIGSPKNNKAPSCERG